MAHTKNVATGNTNSATPPNATTDGNLVVDANNTDSPAVPKAGQSNGPPVSPESKPMVDAPEDANAQLETQELIIEESERRSLQAGKALIEIREKKLAENAGYSSFNAYLRERWNWSRSHAYRLMDATEVGEQVYGSTPIPSAVPTSVLTVIAEIRTKAGEKSVEQRRKECLDDLVEKAEGGRVSIKEAQTAVDLINEKPPKTADSPQKAIAQPVDEKTTDSGDTTESTDESDSEETKDLLRNVAPWLFMMEQFLTGDALERYSKLMATVRERMEKLGVALQPDSNAIKETA